MYLQLWVLITKTIKKIVIMIIWNLLRTWCLWKSQVFAPAPGIDEIYALLVHLENKKTKVPVLFYKL